MDINYHSGNFSARLRPWHDIAKYRKKHSIEYNPNCFNFANQNAHSGQIKIEQANDAISRWLEISISSCYNSALETSEARLYAANSLQDEMLCGNVKCEILYQNLTTPRLSNIYEFIILKEVNAVTLQHIKLSWWGRASGR